jgi:hypothetical protein
MKVSEAEKLLCPFMLYQESSLHELYNPNCSTTRCMAWEKTKGDIVDEIRFDMDELGKFRIREEFIAHHTLDNYNQESLMHFVMREDDECGYCQRINNG